MKKLVRVLTVSAGVLFILAGAFKIGMVLPGGSTLAGQRAFAQMLVQLGVPLPLVFAAAIPALEIIGGIGLISGKGKRVWAALLAFDMIGAIFLVGIPGKSGRAIAVGETKIGEEPWRLPLEIALLFLMLWIAFTPENQKKV